MKADRTKASTPCSWSHIQRSKLLALSGVLTTGLMCLWETFSIALGSRSTSHSAQAVPQHRAIQSETPAVPRLRNPELARSPRKQTQIYKIAHHKDIAAEEGNITRRIYNDAFSSFVQVILNRYNGYLLLKGHMARVSTEEKGPQCGELSEHRGSQCCREKGDLKILFLKVILNIDMKT